MERKREGMWRGKEREEGAQIEESKGGLTRLMDDMAGKETVKKVTRAKKNSTSSNGGPSLLFTSML